MQGVFETDMGDVVFRLEDAIAFDIKVRSQTLAFGGEVGFSEGGAVLLEGEYQCDAE